MFIVERNVLHFFVNTQCLIIWVTYQFYWSHKGYQLSNITERKKEETIYNLSHLLGRINTVKERKRAVSVEKKKRN